MKPIFPLLPRHGVQLFAPCGDGQLFANRFKMTWKRIPLWARRRILTHWKSDHRCNFVGVPTVELMNYWSGKDQNTLACCAREGFMLRFWSDRFDIMPEPVACDVIAHELAHVLQGAHGWRCTSSDDSTYIVTTPHGDELCPGEVEEDADFTIHAWGFNPESIDQWCLDMGFTKAVEFATTEEFFKASLERYASHAGR